MEIPHSGLKGKSISDFKYRYIPDLPDRHVNWKAGAFIKSVRLLPGVLPFG
jgi:hypothetical protein